MFLSKQHDKEMAQVIGITVNEWWEQKLKNRFKSVRGDFSVLSLITDTADKEAGQLRVTDSSLNSLSCAAGGRGTKLGPIIEAVPPPALSVCRLCLSLP